MSSQLLEYIKSETKKVTTEQKNDTADLEQAISLTNVKLRKKAMEYAEKIKRRITGLDSHFDNHVDNPNVKTAVSRVFDLDQLDAKINVFLKQAQKINPRLLINIKTMSEEELMQVIPTRYSVFLDSLQKNFTSGDTQLSSKVGTIWGPSKADPQTNPFIENISKTMAILIANFCVDEEPGVSNYPANKEGDSAKKKQQYKRFTKIVRICWEWFNSNLNRESSLSDAKKTKGLINSIEGVLPSFGGYLDRETKQTISACANLAYSMHKYNKLVYEFDQRVLKDIVNYKKLNKIPKAGKDDLTVSSNKSIKPAEPSKSSKAMPTKSFAAAKKASQASGVDIASVKSALSGYFKESITKKTNKLLKEEEKSQSDQMMSLPDDQMMSLPDGGKAKQYDKKTFAAVKSFQEDMVKLLSTNEPFRIDATPLPSGNSIDNFKPNGIIDADTEHLLTAAESAGFIEPGGKLKIPQAVDVPTVGKPTQVAATGAAAAAAAVAGSDSPASPEAAKTKAKAKIKKKPVSKAVRQKAILKKVRYQDPHTGKVTTGVPMADLQVTLGMLGFFGPNPESKRTFSEGPGGALKADGKYGSETEAAIKALQTLLIDEGFLDKGDDDGLFGPKTSSAMMQSKKIRDKVRKPVEKEEPTSDPTSDVKESRRLKVMSKLTKVIKEEIELILRERNMSVDRMDAEEAKRYEELVSKSDSRFDYSAIGGFGDNPEHARQRYEAFKDYELKQGLKDPNTRPIVTDPKQPMQSLPVSDPDGEAPRPDMQSDPLAPYEQMTPDEIKQQDKQISNALADALIQSFKNPIEQFKILNKYVANVGKKLGDMYRDGKQLVRTKRAAQIRNNKKTGFSMKDMQRMLIRQKLLPAGGDDGKYGINTMTAIMKFQRKNNLKPDGIVGVNTGNKLERLSLSKKERLARLKSQMPLPAAYDFSNYDQEQRVGRVAKAMAEPGVRTAATNQQLKTNRDTSKVAQKRSALKEKNSKVYNYLEKLINEEIDKILG